jgi:sulfite exporter TauE/SafE
MILILLMILAGILLLLSVGFGTFWALAQLGVIVQKVAEPPTMDRQNYSLDQGRDVGDGEQ